MDSAWALPTELKIGDEMYPIRTDYRAILDILRAQSDEELTDQEKTQVLFEILFLDPQNIPRKNLEEACKKAVEFIDCGIKDDGRKKPRLMDWEQDAAIIAPAISNVVGKDIRSVDYMHWWSFMGAYRIVCECVDRGSIDSNIRIARTIRARDAAGKCIHSNIISDG